MSTNDAPLPVSRAADIDTDHQLRQPWLIEGLWAAAGVGILGGNPKIGKSWLGLEMAISIAANTNCLGRFAILEPGPTMVYLAEDALHVVKSRLIALAQHHQRDLRDLDIFVVTAPTMRLDSPADVTRLADAVATLQPRMLVLDPFIRMHRADENDSQQVAAILADLRALQRAHNLAIVLVHHTRKNGRAGQQGLALRGSSDLWAWGDSNLYLTRHHQDIKLTIEHRAAPQPDPLNLVLMTDPPHLEIVDDYQHQTPSLERRIVRLLEHSNAPMTRTQLRQHLAVNNQRLGEMLEQLTASKVILRTKQGWVAP